MRKDKGVVYPKKATSPGDSRSRKEGKRKKFVSIKNVACHATFFPKRAWYNEREDREKRRLRVLGESLWVPRILYKNAKENENTIRRVTKMTNNANKSLSGDFLLEQGIIMLVGEIEPGIATSVLTQMMYLDKKYPGRPIQLWISSPGGEINSGMAIFDVMNYIKSEVHTVAIGMAASMAAFLLSAGTKGKRCALPNAEVLIHQPLGGAQGQATDIINAAKHIENVRSRMNEILAKNTGKDIAQIAIDTDRDKILTAMEAKEYGLIDYVIETTPKAWKN